MFVLEMNNRRLRAPGNVGPRHHVGLDEQMFGAKQQNPARGVPATNKPFLEIIWVDVLNPKRV
jgi:hypothetical protein